MKVTITKNFRGSNDGVSVRNFVEGEVLEVTDVPIEGRISTDLANVAVDNEWAELVDDEGPVVDRNRPEEGFETDPAAVQQRVDLISNGEGDGGEQGPDTLSDNMQETADAKMNDDPWNKAMAGAEENKAV